MPSTSQTAPRSPLWFGMIALGMGLVLGWMLAPKPKKSAQQDGKRRRVNTNIVFGNIILGSNNAPYSHMPMGIREAQDKD